MKKRMMSVLLLMLVFLLAACSAEKPAGSSISSAASEPVSQLASSEAAKDPPSAAEELSSAASASEGNGLAGQVIGGSEPLYLGTLAYDAIEFTVDNAFDIKDHTGDYIATGRGDVHMPSGATLKPGSSLKGENMIQITELTDNAVVAFTYTTELTEDDLVKALDRFAEDNLLDDGTGTMEAICYLYTDEYVCLLFPSDRVGDNEVWFCIPGEGEIILAMRE